MIKKKKSYRMNLFLSRTCLAVWQPQLSCCKRALFISPWPKTLPVTLSTNMWSAAPKRECVCTGLASLEAALMAPLYLLVYVTKQNKPGNNMPSDHSYCLTTGSLAGGVSVSQTVRGDSLWHQPTPLDSTDRTSSTIQHALHPWTPLLAAPWGPIML